MDDLSPAERALIKKLRSGDLFRLYIERGPANDQWNVTRAEPRPSRDPGITGMGPSFEWAWNNCWMD